MLIPMLILGVFAIILLIIGFFKGEGQHILGLKRALELTLQILPLLLLAFVVTGMIQVLIPQEQITQWIGKGSGGRGILLGTLAGAITPGGPFISLPIVAGLLQAGASLGTLVAFITSWALLAVNRIPLELGILGWKFALFRFLSTFFFPPIAGFIAEKLFSRYWS